MSLPIVLVHLCLLFLPAAAPDNRAANSSYVLSTDDGLAINVVDLAELDGKTLGNIRIDHQGNINLPLAGRIRADGLTVEQLETEIASRLQSIMNHPEVSVSIAEYRSHPVSVLGSVRVPGVYQVSGRKTLYEVLSLAGGMNADAGNTVKITRLRNRGQLLLPGGQVTESGDYAIGQINLHDALEAKSPAANIEVVADDVITVPRADLVYVVGAVKRAGGFPLAEKEHISVLQAVSLAEGLDRAAGLSNAKILRQTDATGDRVEVAVDLKSIMQGRARDVALQANDILFVPNSAAKSASYRAMEAAVQAATGVIIFAR